MTARVDLSSWLSQVSKMGELKLLEGAHWNLEIGCITALNWGKRDAPALLFDQIQGYPKGFKVLTGSLLSRNRLALTFGLSQNSSARELTAALCQKLPQWESSSGSFAPLVVKEGPVMQKVQSGEDVNLLQFPAPKWHEKDGGRYIGTGDAVITRDPDSKIVNVGTYRVVVHDEKTLGIHIAPGQHGRLNLEKYHARGEHCPIAISLGHHPLIFAVSALSLPEGMEYSYMGAIRGEPLAVIQEEVTGLPVPADSELVVAGWSPPGKTRLEGPFGEFPGYYASKERPNPIIEVERVYYRDNPTIIGAPPGRPPDEMSYFDLIVSSAFLENELRKVGVPEIRGVCAHPLPRNFFVAVSVRQRYAGHAKRAALALVGSRAMGMGRYIIVVDEDIDVTDIREVIWAMCTRSDPEKDIDIIRDIRTSQLDPMVKRPAEVFSTSWAVINACKPYEWIKEFPEVVEVSPELKAETMKRWGKFLGLPDVM